MSSNDVVKEIAKAVGMKLGKEYKSDRQAFYKKLVAAADELDDEEWEALSDGAQRWVNAAIDAINEGEAVPDPEDLEEEEEEAEEPDEEPATGDEEDEDGEGTDDEDDEDEDEDEDDEDDEQEEKEVKKETAKKKAAPKKKATAKKSATTKKKAAAKKAPATKKKATAKNEKPKKTPEKKTKKKADMDPVMAFLAKQSDPLSVSFAKVWEHVQKKDPDRAEATARMSYTKFRAAYAALQKAGKL